MNANKHILVILLVLPLFLFLSSEEEESHSSSIMGYVGKVINFLVLFGGLAFLLRKPLKKFLDRRGQEIGTSIKEAKEERKENEKRFKEILGRLQRLEKEIVKIREHAEEEGRKRKESVFQAAEREADRIKHFAHQEIDMFYQAKIRELRLRTAEMATALAKKSIEERMTPEKQALLVDQSISKLEDLYEKQNPR